jgi:hypothetical protein
LIDSPDAYVIYRDFISGLEYIRPSQELLRQGLYLELNAYHCLVLMEFREVMDDGSHSIAGLNAYLEGKGVPDFAEAQREYDMREVLTPYRELVHPGFLSWLVQNRIGAESYTDKDFRRAISESEQKLKILLVKVKEVSGGQLDVEPLLQEIQSHLVSLLTITEIKKTLPVKMKPASLKVVDWLLSGDGVAAGLVTGDPVTWGPLICALLTNKLGGIVGENGSKGRSRTWIDEWLFGKYIRKGLEELGLDAGTSQRSLELICSLASSQGWYEPRKSASELAGSIIQTWLNDADARRFLQVNAYQGALWFNRESFEELIWWTVVYEIILLKAEPKSTPEGFEQILQTCFQVKNQLEKAKEESGYQLEKLI